MSDNHLSVLERVVLVVDKSIKRDPKFSLTSAYKAFLIKYGPLYFHEKSQYDLILGMVKDLDLIVNQGMAKAIHYKKCEAYSIPIRHETDWIEYEPQLKGHYPDDYGRYLVTKTSNCMVFLTWGPERWGISDSLVTHYRKIYMTDRIKG